MEAGRHELVFDASRLTSGVYIYMLSSGNNSSSKRMVLIK